MQEPRLGRMQILEHPARPRFVGLVEAAAAAEAVVEAS